MILKKISGFEGEKHVFFVFLAFRPIFGGLPIINGGKMAIFDYRAVFPNSLSKFNLRS